MRFSDIPLPQKFLFNPKKIIFLILKIFFQKQNVDRLLPFLILEIFFFQFKHFFFSFSKIFSSRRYTFFSFSKIFSSIQKMHKDSFLFLLSLFSLFYLQSKKKNTFLIFKQFFQSKNKIYIAHFLFSFSKIFSSIQKKISLSAHSHKYFDPKTILHSKTGHRGTRFSWSISLLWLTAIH